MSLKQPGARGTAPLLVAIVVLVLMLTPAAFLSNQYLSPIPALEARPQIQAERTIGTAPSLPWPSTGSAAVSMKDWGFIAASGGDTPRPIASTTKIMAAFLTLENHPLTQGQKGPEVTITAQDVADYQKAVKEGQSSVPVTVGEKLTEYQLLQGLLLPSGNNIADVLAKWDAGTKDAFIAKMNARAAALGMSHTHYDDASGFSAKTVSTPSDLLILGSKAMADPVFREIVAMDKATLPVAGVVRNVNTILGKDGNIGIKTGSTDEAGGCFVSASTQQVAGKPTEVYAAVLGQDKLNGALDATAALSRSVAANFAQARVLNRSDVVATMTSAWGESVQAVPSQDLDMLVWPGTKLKTNLQLSDTIQAPLPAGTKVGELTLELGPQKQKVDVVTTASVAEPTWQWRTMRFLHR